MTALLRWRSSLAVALRFLRAFPIGTSDECITKSGSVQIENKFTLKIENRGNAGLAICRGVRA
jgi:hypothetical protein